MPPYMFPYMLGSPPIPDMAYGFIGFPKGSHDCAPQNVFRGFIIPAVAMERVTPAATPSAICAAVSVSLIVIARVVAVGRWPLRSAGRFS